MKFVKIAVVVIAAFAVLTTPVFACQEDDCPHGNHHGHHRHHHHHHFAPPNPQTNITGFNNAPIVAIINAGSLDAGDAVNFENTAAGVNITVPAGCGECPGGMSVSGVNTGTIDAIVNIGNANIRGPLTVGNTAVGVNINAGKK